MHRMIGRQRPVAWFALRHRNGEGLGESRQPGDDIREKQVDVIVASKEVERRRGVLTNPGPSYRHSQYGASAR
jgi:hypothetical protein